MEEWLENVYFFETSVLEKARTCKAMKDDDLFTMIRWAIYADKSWHHGLLSHHIKSVMPNVNEPPSRRLLRAFVQNPFLSQPTLRYVASTLSDQLPKLRLGECELFLLLDQRQAFLRHLESFVVPRLADAKPLKAIIKRLLLDVSHSENFRLSLLKAAYKEDFQTTQWLIELLMSEASEEKQNELLRDIENCVKSQRDEE